MFVKINTIDNIIKMIKKKNRKKLFNLLNFFLL